MPSEASFEDLEVKTTSHWFWFTISVIVGQSLPFLGIQLTGNMYLVRPVASKTFVKPLGDVT
ncbi:hypothetical protein HanRHA438_Chr04g0193671 [Helianthus annuus]|nr:hypothetical protein HanIR_Chr04g0197951 [Helianthus annuus]KAJ0928402.1 hypothetical protein HanRHA438_Chr04g0193671 [Helianthus annuus]